MNIILLSGGSGKRLWPLSNDIRSKQFLQLFHRPEHSISMGTACSPGLESMVQRMYRQIRTLDPEARLTIATSKSQVAAIHNQLGEKVSICVEPCRRDTFPAIALAGAYLHDRLRVDPGEPVVVCPVDPYVEDGYFLALQRLGELAGEGRARLLLMGIDPTYPSEKYGYILPETGEEVSRVREFREKPDAATARGYIEEGGLWNGGVFAFRLSYLLEKSRELAGTDRYEELLAWYEGLQKISFDFAVSEKERDIAVLRYHGTWKDLGTWNTLTEAMQEPSLGDVRMDGTCSGVHVINELGVPVLVMGAKDMVVCASAEGILVSDKEQSSYIKPYVDSIDHQVMFAEKSWGSYRVLDVEKGSMTVKVTLNPGHRMNYHSHDRRDEVWTVISGTGRTIVDGMVQEVGPGDVVTMDAGCRHTVIAGTRLVMIEVQLGEEILAADKHKYEDPII